MKNTKKWLTIDEAAEYYGLSLSTIWRRIVDGTLTSKFREGRWWVLIGDDDEEEKPLDTVSKLDPLNILSDLEMNLIKLERHHSSIMVINCKIIKLIRPRSEDDDQANEWHPLSGKITRCLEAIRQMRQSGSLDTNTIQNIIQNIQVLREDWERYHRTIVEKYHRLNPTINTNPSREGIAILNRIITQLEKLNRLVRDRYPLNWF